MMLATVFSVIGAAALSLRRRIFDRNRGDARPARGRSALALAVTTIR
jgi:hypothetical protein